MSSMRKKKGGRKKRLLLEEWVGKTHNPPPLPLCWGNSMGRPENNSESHWERSSREGIKKAKMAREQKDMP